MPQQVRFTPEEIRALMASGELPMDLIRKMHPDDQKVAQAIFNSHDYSQTDGHPASVPEQLAHIGSQVKNHPLAAAGMGAALAVPLATTGALGMGASAIAGELPMMAKVAGYTGLAALGSKLGIPASAMEAVALYMGMKGGMGKMTGSAAPAEAMTVEQELAKKGINSANVGRSTPVQTRLPTDTDPVILNLKRRSPVQPPVATPGGLGNEALDVEKKIFGPQGSEAATFGARPPAYSPNVSTGASVDDLLEMLTGSSHGAGTPDGSPIMYHGNFDAAREDVAKATRNSVDRLKRATRRSPK